MTGKSFASKEEKFRQLDNLIYDPSYVIKSSKKQAVIKVLT